MTDEEKKDQEEFENLKIGYDLLQKDYVIQVERLKTADEKLNMFLVFNAAILALLTIVFPLPTICSVQFIISIIALTLFIASMVLTLIMIILAVFPRKTEHIDDSNYVTAEFYHCTSISFLGKIMSESKKSIESLHKLTELKFRYAKIAMSLTIVNIGLMIILILITLL